MSGGCSWEQRLEASWQPQGTCLEACSWCVREEKSFVKLILALGRQRGRHLPKQRITMTHFCSDTAVKSVCTELISSSLHGTLRIGQRRGHLEETEADLGKTPFQGCLKGVEPGIKTQSPYHTICVSCHTVSREVATALCLWRSHKRRQFSLNSRSRLELKNILVESQLSVAISFLTWTRCTLALSFVIWPLCHFLHDTFLLDLYLLAVFGGSFTVWVPHSSHCTTSNLFVYLALVFWDATTEPPAPLGGVIVAVSPRCPKQCCEHGWWTAPLGQNEI